MIKDEKALNEYFNSRYDKVFTTYKGEYDLGIMEFDTYVLHIRKFYQDLFETSRPSDLYNNKPHAIKAEMAERLVSVYKDALIKKKIKPLKYRDDLLLFKKDATFKAKEIYTDAIDYYNAKVDYDDLIASYPKEPLEKGRKIEKVALKYPYPIDKNQTNCPTRLESNKGTYSLYKNTNQMNYDPCTASIKSKSRLATKSTYLDSYPAEFRVHEPPPIINYSIPPVEFSVYEPLPIKNYNIPPAKFRRARPKTPPIINYSIPPAEFHGGGYRRNKAMTMKDIKELCKANQIKLSKVVDGKRVVYKKKELITKLKRKKLL
jgi:hypothetical protein